MAVDAVAGATEIIAAAGIFFSVSMTCIKPQLVALAISTKNPSFFWFYCFFSSSSSLAYRSRWSLLCSQIYA
jgi:hypothetical protein